MLAFPTCFIVPLNSFQSLLLPCIFFSLSFVVYLFCSFSPQIWVTTNHHKASIFMASYDQGKPLPKFGEWDVNDPASAEGFTVIFNKARDEKKTGGGGGSGRTASQRRSNSRKEDDKSSKAQSSSMKKWFCFKP